MAEVRSYDEAGWEANVQAICAELEGVEGAILPALHELMAQYGYISEPALNVLAAELHLTSPQVFAVATFYNEFRLAKPAENTLVLCRGPACRVEGMVELRKLLEERLGISVGGRTADNRFAIESAGCLGICPFAPVLEINHRLTGRVTPPMLRRLIDEKSGAPV